MIVATQFDGRLANWAENQTPARHLDHFVGIVVYEPHSGAGFGCLADSIQRGCRTIRVEVASGLVQDNHVRVADECATDRGPDPLTTA
jgi:hypothetical protein